MTKKGRILFMIRLKPGTEERFLEAYSSIRHAVAQSRGHLCDQLCKSSTEPDRWLLTSEWESVDDFVAWVSTDEHRELVEPMRRCMAASRGLRFEVHRETQREPTKEAP